MYCRQKKPSIEVPFLFWNPFLSWEVSLLYKHYGLERIFGGNIFKVAFFKFFVPADKNFNSGTQHMSPTWKMSLCSSSVRPVSESNTAQLSWNVFANFCRRLSYYMSGLLVLQISLKRFRRYIGKLKILEKFLLRNLKLTLEGMKSAEKVKKLKVKARFFLLDARTKTSWKKPKV